MAVPLNHKAARFTPFLWRIFLRGIDLSAATWHMHVRTKFDAPGAPILALANVGVEQTLGIYRFAPVVIEGITVSQVDVFIPRANMIAMPPAAVLGSDAELVYDLHVEAAGQPDFNMFRGTFIVEAGATQHA